MLKRLTANKFINSLGWLGLSELIIRITRLVAAVVLARMLDPVTFGLAAIVLTVNELVRVMNQNGISAKIVQCEEAQLEEICNTAYRINFILCLGLCAIQCLIAYPLASFYQAPQIIPMLQVLSLVYLMMPFGMVQSALVKRRQRMKIRAVIDGGQVAVDNLITAALALCGLGAWAIVLPKFLTAPIWVIGYRKAMPWRHSGRIFEFKHFSEIFVFGRYFLSIECLKAARMNLDNLIIGRLLGMEILGLYYFARNAGLGFSLSLCNAINVALFPNLCEIANDNDRLKQRFVNRLLIIAVVVIPLISLQVFLAPWYVPIIFGEQWISAIPVLMMLCLSAMVRPFADGASALLISKNLIKIDLKWQLVFTIIFLMTVSITSLFNIYAVAGGILLVYVITHPVYVYYSWNKLFRQKPIKYTNKELMSW